MPQTVDKPSRYVVVLAHADGWGALSANKVVKSLHAKYPDLGVHLIVSQATKDPEGNIKTKLDDLKPVRELKETNLLKFFEVIDKQYAETPDIEELQTEFPNGVASAEEANRIIEVGAQNAAQRFPKFLTFKQLAAKYCADAAVHYTTSGGKKGGQQLGAFGLYGTGSRIC
jgi:hypothetical protein